MRLESLANLAHELRTPVQALLGYLEILGDRTGRGRSAQTREIIGRMNANVQDLAQTVENVLDFAFSGAEAESHAFEKVDLRDLMAEIAPAVEALNREKKLALHCAIDESVRVVSISRRPLKSILLNLAVTR